DTSLAAFSSSLTRFRVANKITHTMGQISLLERILLFYGTRLPNHPRKWWLHSRLRSWAGVRIDRDMEVIREGLRWSLNPAVYGHTGVFWWGQKDSWALFPGRRLVRHDDLFFDVGANCGYYAAPLATALDRRCKVPALEPIPANFLRLCQHLSWNDLEH